MRKIEIFILFAFLMISLAGGTASAQYTVGDIILSDGSGVKAEELTSVDSANLPVAVIAGLNDDGTAFGLGVHRSENPLQWEVDDIYAQDHADDEDASEGYPALNFVDTYAENYDLVGDYASEWYMPDIIQLRTVYENREIINAALKKIYSLDSSASMDGLDTNWYWASTQSESDDEYVWFVHFFNGYADKCPKNFTNLHVLAVRGFSEENKF